MVATISSVGNAILQAVNQYKKQPTTTPQKQKTTNNSQTIGPKLRAMQQNLSEKFGIPTFDVQGRISTIPKTRPLNTAINVGTGSTGLDQNTFNELLKRFTPTTFTTKTEEAFIPGFGGINKQPVGTTPQHGEIILPPGPGITDTLKSGLSTIGPIGLVVGAIILGVVLLKKI